MMRKISVQAVLAATAFSVGAVFAPACAQDAEEAPAAAAAEDGLPPSQPEAKPFTSLFKCERATGAVQILKPNASEWTAVKERRYYPLGSSVRILDEAGTSGSAEFSFGPESSLKMEGAAEVATRPIEIGDSTRTVELKSGRVMLNLPRTLKEGLFFVTAPNFTCSNLSGESLFDYQLVPGGGDEVVLRCVTGTMTLEGRHFKIPRMAAANQVRIRTTDNNLFSWLRGESGDSKVTLDQGMVVEKNFETGEEKDVPKTLEFSLSPRCAIKIFRRVSKSGNMLVSTMTFDASGQIKNRCVFAEGRSNVNSGELVIAPVAAASAEKEKAKAASEETEEVEAVGANPSKAKADDAAADDEKKDEKKEEKKKDDDADI